MTKVPANKKIGLRGLRTEQPNAAAQHLDIMPALDVARLMNREDMKVAGAVTSQLPRIAQAIELAAAALSRGGRLIYVGAGTSGRIAALDALECPPTFGVDPRSVQVLIAGGKKALTAAVEASEDDDDAGREQMARLQPGKNDLVVGIAASGRTPFTVAAVRCARRRGAQTLALTCNANSPLERAAHLAVVTGVGPEVLAGSSRLKAATAHKMVLNMISTGTMSRLGYIYGNRMVNVVPRNGKLMARAVGTLQEASGATAGKARAALRQSGNRTPRALVMLLAGVTSSEAAAALNKSGGHVRAAIALARKRARPI